MKLHFSIVIRLDKKNSQKVRSIIKSISKKYKVYGALNDSKGPHISLAYFDDEVGLREIGKITSGMIEQLKSVRPFNVQIKSTGTFRKRGMGNLNGNINYVVYLRVQRNKDLTKVYKIANSYAKPYQKHKVFDSFRPHMSLARKDIDRKTFLEIERDFADFNPEIISKVDSTYAMRRAGRGKPWRVERIRLGQTPHI
jgi:2'-5' RNA ligase